MPTLSVLVLLLLPALAFSESPGDPFNGQARGTWTTRGGGTGFAMDVAIAGSTLYLLDQDDARGDQLIAIDRGSERVLRTLPIGNRLASAVAAEGESIWVLRRGAKEFLRRYDATGQPLESVSVKKLPKGLVYALALDAEAFFFTVVAEGRSTLYRLGRREEIPKEIASFDGKLIALAKVDDTIYGSLSHLQPHGAHWLVALRGDGSLIWKLRAATGQAMGLDHDGRALYAMTQRGAEAEIERVVPDPVGRVVTGGPRLERLRLEYRWEVPPGAAATVTQVHALPRDLDFQRIRHLRSTPAYSNVRVDRDGNSWADVRVTGEGTLAIVWEMDVAALSVGVTLDPDAPPDEQAFAAVAREGLGETSVFDVSSPDVQRLVAGIPRAASHVGLLGGVYDAVGGALVSQKYTGKNSRNASDVLSAGIGRCYGHTVAFASVARGLGLPARAIGGIELADYPDFDAIEREPGAHTWNQAFVPGAGWVDFDSQFDDDERAGQQRRGVFARHNNRYVITFLGSYGQRNERSQFADRNWFMHWSARRPDSGLKTPVRYRGLLSDVTPLARW